ncbi:MAG: hypothetical protein ACLRIS_12320 [Flavonifractor plautii]
MNMISGIYFPDGDTSAWAGGGHHPLPQGRLRPGHRHDPPALQAGGRVHRGGEHCPGPGGEGGLRSPGRRPPGEGDQRKVRL